MATKIVQLSEGAVTEILGRIARLEDAIEKTYRRHPCRGNLEECWLCLLRDELDRAPLPTGIENVVERG